MDCSVVVPVYNSESTLRELDRRLHNFFLARGDGFELLYVDDGSVDGSWDILEELRARSPEHVRIIRLDGNHGQHLATLCGIRQARLEMIVTLDDDLETPPEEIEKLLRALVDTGSDVIYGYTFSPPHSLLRNVSSIVFKQIVRLLTGSRGMASSFRALRARVVPRLEENLQAFVVIDAALMKSRCAIGYVPVTTQRQERVASGYSYWKLMQLAFKIMLHYLLFPNTGTTLAFFAGLAGLTLAFLCVAMYWGGVIMTVCSLAIALLCGAVLVFALKNRMAFRRALPRPRIAASL